MMMPRRVSVGEWSGGRGLIVSMGASFIKVIDSDKWQLQMSALIMETQTNKVFYCLLDLSSGFNLILLTTYVFLFLQKPQELTYWIKILAGGLYFARNEGETGFFAEASGSAGSVQWFISEERIHRSKQGSKTKNQSGWGRQSENRTENIGKKVLKKQNPKKFTCNPANWKLAEGGKTWTRINKVDKTKSEQGRQPKHVGAGGSQAGKEIKLQNNNREIQTITLEITRNTPEVPL